jgi:hypothetical protein
MKSFALIALLATAAYAGRLTVTDTPQGCCITVEDVVGCSGVISGGLVGTASCASIVLNEPDATLTADMKSDCGFPAKIQMQYMHTTDAGFGGIRTTVINTDSSSSDNCLLPQLVAGQYCST